ncbi:uncharacterized protein DFL_004439 [Arthrobotrys flagrans]|uniref:Nucleoside phosphorylase domain-containing protein n=1 Tax=Arthrobotrys flagrans TaxID=97331 RepID=A0A437A4X0_ARTFL|nr:hypothetical protein DFL_004439 [Arthrobotrys flagrans]
MEPDPSLLRPVTEYTIGWICALALEQTVSGSVLDRIHSYRRHHDVPLDGNNLYILGNIGGHNIAIATLPKELYGNIKAAIIAAQLLSVLQSTKILFMVGIGGRIPNLDEGVDVRLGDVVVSVPEGRHSGVVKWDMGKTEKGSKLNRTGSLNRPPEKLLNAINNPQFQHNLFGSQISNYVAEVHEKYSNLRAFSYLGPEGDNLYQAVYEHKNEKSRTYHACNPTRTAQRKPRISEDSTLVL